MSSQLQKTWKTGSKRWRTLTIIVKSSNDIKSAPSRQQKMKSSKDKKRNLFLIVKIVVFFQITCSWRKLSYVVPDFCFFFKMTIQSDEYQEVGFINWEGAVPVGKSMRFHIRSIKWHSKFKKKWLWDLASFSQGNTVWREKGATRESSLDIVMLVNSHINKFPQAEFYLLGYVGGHADEETFLHCQKEVE